MKQINSLKDIICKFTQEEKGNMNRSISIKGIESIINYLPKQKTPHLDGFTDEFHQLHEEEIILVVYNLFQK